MKKTGFAGFTLQHKPVLSLVLPGGILLLVLAGLGVSPFLNLPGNSLFFTMVIITACFYAGSLGKRKMEIDHREQQELKEIKECYDRLTGFTGEIIFRLRVDGWRVTYVNPAAEKAFGYPLKKWRGTPGFIFKLLHPDCVQTLEDAVKHLDRRTETVHTLELKWLDAHRHIVMLEMTFIPVWDGAGRLVFIEAIGRNVTRRKQEENRIKFLSYYDKLTGLYNRAFFEEELTRIDTFGHLPLSIIMLDVNGLKLTNDTFGHFEGDKLLTGTARVLKKSCRKDDIVCRWGGDEFIILLPQTDEKTAVNICTRIKKMTARARAKKAGGPIVPLSFALGMAVKTNPGQDMEKIIKEAESRMYQEKLVEQESFYNSLLSSLQQSLATKEYSWEKYQRLVRKLAVLQACKTLTLSETLTNSQILE